MMILNMPVVADADGPGYVTRDAMIRTDAEAYAERCRAAGHETSTAPDAEDRSLWWVYVSDLRRAEDVRS